MTARPEELQKLSPPKQLTIKTEQSQKRAVSTVGNSLRGGVHGRAAAAAACACPKLRLTPLMRILQE